MNKNHHLPEQAAILQCIEIINTSEATNTTYRPTWKATVKLNKTEVSANLEEALRHAASSQDIRSYMQNKCNWSDEIIENINWMIHGNAIQTLPQRMQKTTIQFIHEWLPTLMHYV